ncbi:hypothetical protein E2C01_069361 [Portunus trituberculatus]|uniref:Uncharacterized protein n=1 Tax=Portunus trituberculatus TaxID=210409 RepID=A0A5B7I0K6_PORTR|nr:hypothetical protein [Portunus trituberculatus]
MGRQYRRERRNVSGEGGGDAEGVCRMTQKTSTARRRRRLQQDAKSVCRRMLMASGGCRQSFKWPRV